MIISTILYIGLIFAQEATADTEWFSYLLQGGPFAIVVFLFLTDRVATTNERDSLRAEVKLLNEQIEELNKEIRKEIVPALVAVNTVTRDAMDALKRRQHDL